MLFCLSFSEMSNFQLFPGAVEQAGVGHPIRISRERHDYGSLQSFSSNQFNFTVLSKKIILVHDTENCMKNSK